MFIFILFFNTNERNKNEKIIIKGNLLYKYFYRDVNFIKNKLRSCVIYGLKFCLLFDNDYLIQRILYIMELRKSYLIVKYKND